MKILKKILIAIVILIAAVLITALFVKKDYAVEREVEIKRPKAVVFEYIKYLKNQDNYSIWNTKDPKMKKSYKGEDATVGFTYFWEGNSDVGKGEQEIIKITDGERLDLKLRFKKPMKSESDAYLSTTSIDSNTTKVKWGFVGKTPYPWNFMGLFMDMDKMVGGDLATGLSNLKMVLEKQ